MREEDKRSWFYAASTAAPEPGPFPHADILLLPAGSSRPPACFMPEKRITIFRISMVSATSAIGSFVRAPFRSGASPRPYADIVPFVSPLVNELAVQSFLLCLSRWDFCA